MSDIKLIKELFLTDEDGEKVKVIDMRGVESGLDYLELSTQTKFQRESGIKTVHKIFTSEELTND